MMIETTIKAVLGITLIICGWLSVQMAWRRVFARSIAANEVTFGRCGCHSCCRSMCDEFAVDEKDRAEQAEHGEQPTPQEV